MYLYFHGGLELSRLTKSVVRTVQERTKSLLVTRDHEAVAKAVEQSCINKAEVVAMDEREAGVRAKLNLGHTFGHAIEVIQKWKKYMVLLAVLGGYIHIFLIRPNKVCCVTLSNQRLALDTGPCSMARP